MTPRHFYSNQFYGFHAKQFISEIVLVLWFLQKEKPPYRTLRW